MKDARGERTNSDPRIEKLTIGRIMLLTAGVGAGLVCYAPRQQNFDARSIQSWREMATAVLIGLSLPGVYYALRRSRRARLRVGGSLWLLVSLGAWLLTPPAIAGPLLHLNAMGSGSAGACLFYVLPLLGFWFTLSATMTGQLRWRHLRAEEAWTDRFGVYLGLAWTVLGVWITCEFYWEAFVK